MDIYSLSDEHVAELVHSFLTDSFWPSHLKVGDEFRLRADDQVGKDTGLITIKIRDKETITIETVRKIPDPNIKGKRIEQVYRALVTKRERPVAFRGVLCLALAFRLDEHARETAVRKELKRTRSKNLRVLYELLEQPRWFPTLRTIDYFLEGDMSPWPTKNCALGVSLTELNDEWLWIGSTTERFRGAFGGGYGYHRVTAALRILAEAIRLENEKTP